MSENVRSTSCRPSGIRSSRWITLTTIVAMFGFAGLAFADSNNQAPKRTTAPKMVSVDPSGDEAPPAGNAAVAVAANDTCAGAIALTLGISQKVDSVGAADDYQTPATAACYPGLAGTQVPTTAPGRDVVFSFEAPATDSYTFRLTVDAVTNDFRNQNGVLYLVDGPGCFAAGEVTCLSGANRAQSRAFYSAIGGSDNHGEEVSCVSLSAGQKVFAVFDDFRAGNNGSNPKIEVIKCVSETEPNGSPATANAYTCDLQGTSNAAPTAHCKLGTNDGAVCTRSGKLDVSFAPQTDLDCNPLCIGGPNAGLACITNAFCNPGGVDVGSICAGVCVNDSVCTGGVNNGLPCTATCVGGPRDGLFCAIGANAVSLVSVPINGSGVFAVPPILITGCGAGFACVQNNACPGGACTQQNNEGDADFFSIGVVPAGNKVFTAIDGNTANDMDWRLRVTTDTDTLQYDDEDGNFTTGTRSPVIAGALGTGVPTYVKVSRTTPRLAEAYHLNAIIRPPVAAAQLESEVGPFSGNDTYFYWPSNTVNANPVTAGGYIKGDFTALDSDCFKFCVNKGDFMHWYGDGNPDRIAPPGIVLAQLAQPIIYDSDGAGISNFIFGAEPRANVLPSSPTAGLNGLTPRVTSSYSDYRATYTGQIEVCYYEPSSRVTPAPIPGYSPGPWAGSLSVNCGPVDDCTTVPASLVATKTGPTGPVNNGDIVDYTIVITNNGPGIAADVHLQDFLDGNTIFLGLSVEDGFDKDGDGAEGDNTVCFLLPTPGQNDAFVDCINASIAPGASVTYTLSVQVNNCIGAGVDITNSATIDTRSIDSNAAGNCDILNIFTGEFESLPCENPSVTFSTSQTAGCNDIICDDVSCVANLCTEGDTCDGGGNCVPGAAPDCDDDSLCTEDSCDPATGCVNDSSQLGDLCNNAGTDQCLEDFCDPVLFCQTRPVDCDDDNPCTDDSCDSGTGCVHTNNTSACEDGDACTTGDTCGGGVCNPGSAVSCDDGNACNGVETCDSGTGCVAGTPVVCTASDQCHDAGTCDPDTGTCSDPAKADGTTCDDGNASTSGDVCTGGVCAGSTCTSTDTPKTSGYYKKLCNLGHTGALTDADAACVGEMTATFAGISTVNDVCAVFGGAHPSRCEKSDQDLMALALNICQERVCPSTSISSECGGNTTVGASFSQADLLQSSPGRNNTTCTAAQCLTTEINNGKALN